MGEPVMRGRAAELIFHAKCLKNRLECFSPSTEDGRIDLIVGPQFYRCQVKALVARGHAGTRHLDLQKRKGPAGSRMKFRYSVADIDFMIGVSLETFATYIVPIACTSAWSTTISEQALHQMGSLDAFHLLHARRGESLSPLSPKPMKGRRPRDRFGEAARIHDQLPILGAGF